MTEYNNPPEDDGDQEKDFPPPGYDWFSKKEDFLIPDAEEWILRFPELGGITHDGMAKSFLSDPRIAPVFLSEFVKKYYGIKAADMLDFENLKIVKSDFTLPILTERRADVLYRIPLKNLNREIPVVVMIEHKSEFHDIHQEKLTIFQMMEYNIGILAREIKNLEASSPQPADFILPPVIPILFHHGSKPFRGFTDFSDLYPELKGTWLESFIPHWKIAIFDLAIISDSEIPNPANLPFLRCVLTVMKNIYDKAADEKIANAFIDFNRQRQNSQYDELAEDLYVYTIAHTKLDKESDYKITQNLHTTDQFKERKMNTIQWRWLEAQKQGILEGRQEGRQQGIQEGRLKEARELVISLLKAKFGEIPADVRSRIEDMHDKVALTSLAISCSNSQSMEEFMQDLL